MPTPAPHNPNNITGPSILKLRKLLGMGQAEFWAPLCTTQSGGSRYERVLAIPSAVQKLATFVYREEIEEFGKQAGIKRGRK